MTSQEIKDVEEAARLINEAGALLSKLGLHSKCLERKPEFKKLLKQKLSYDGFVTIHIYTK